MEEQQFIISSSPHIRTDESIQKIMITVIKALLPVVFMSVFIFGMRAAIMIAVSISASVVTESIFNKVRGKKNTINDGSAILAGLLLALTLPPSFPYLGAMLGSVVAIGLGKMIFGGLGFNIFNPALVGRAFLQAAFPVQITTWTAPFAGMSTPGVDAVTAATPLSLMSDKVFTKLSLLFVGNVAGSLGETSAIAIFIGAFYLYKKGYIQWRIPVSIFISTLLMGGLFWFIDSSKYPDPVFHILVGGMALGALFMATDMVTSPITNTGYWIFGTGIGCLTVLIRLQGGLPEGVMYSILLMNSITPLINKFTVPKVFGRVKA